MGVTLCISYWLSYWLVSFSSNQPTNRQITFQLLPNSFSPSQKAMVYSSCSLIIVVIDCC